MQYNISTHCICMHTQGVMVDMLLERVVARRAGKWPRFAMVMGDEESDDMMYQVYIYIYLYASIYVYILS